MQFLIFMQFCFATPHLCGTWHICNDTFLAFFLVLFCISSAHIWHIAHATSLVLKTNFSNVSKTPMMKTLTTQHMALISVSKKQYDPLSTRIAGKNTELAMQLQAIFFVDVWNFWSKPSKLLFFLCCWRFEVKKKKFLLVFNGFGEIMQRKFLQKLIQYNNWETKIVQIF